MSVIMYLRRYYFKEMKKSFYRGNIILLLCAIMCLICYDIFGGLWLKGFTSTWFVMLGLVNLTYAKKIGVKLDGFLVLIELGLICGMCADVLLGVFFILGIIFFALGHVFYLIAFCKLEKLQKRDITIVFPIAVISLLVVVGTPFIQVKDSVIEKLLLGYAVIIACMVGKAISNICERKTVFRWLVLLGSVMFWFSDLVLAIDMFGQSSRLTWILCSYVYWPAQNILAFSLFHYINECREKNHCKRPF